MAEPSRPKWMTRRWYRMRTKTSVAIAAGVVFGLHLALSAGTRNLTVWDSSDTLLGAAYFVFGLFAAFALDHARSSAGRVQELLKSTDADLISLYELSTSFGADQREQVRDLLDTHLQDQIDYRLDDFENSTDSFLAIFELVRNLHPTGTAQSSTYQQMLAICVQTIERRKQIEALVRQRMSRVEWLVLLALFGSLWALILTPTDGVIGPVLGGVLIASLAAVLVLLKHIDDLRWQESDAIWHPLHTLFRVLDLDPYYPAPVIDQRRVDPPSGPLRRVNYPHPYPDMSDKQITTVDHLHGARRR